MIKTHKGAAKRFKLTKKGKIKHKRANRNHILTKKTAKRMRSIRGLHVVDATNEKAIYRLLANSL